MQLDHCPRLSDELRDRLNEELKSVPNCKSYDIFVHGNGQISRQDSEHLARIAGMVAIARGKRSWSVRAYADEELNRGKFNARFLWDPRVGETTPAGEEEASDLADDCRLLELLVAVRHLPYRQRRIVWRRIRGQGPTEIAKALNLTNGHVTANEGHAVKGLRVLFRQAYGRSTPRRRRFWAWLDSRREETER